MKILLVGNFLGSDTNPGVGEEMAVYLEKHGHVVNTVSHKHNRIVRLIDILSVIWRQRNEFDIVQVDVFSGLAFFWAELACFLLRSVKGPFVLTLHGGNLPVFAKRRQKRVRNLLVSASAVTAPSGYLCKEMQPYRQDICLIPNPVDISKYPFRIRSHPRPVLIWLRAFHKIYNPTLAPRVLASLVSEFSDISLLMVGPDKGDGSLQKTKKIARKLQVMDRIEFSGGVPKEDVPEWLNKGDIFINTTNIDNTPVSVIEAMACGLCVVSTNVGGIPYLLEHEQDALLVSPDNPETMANAVRRLLSEPALAEQLSFNARKKAEQFDWLMILPQWEALFSNLTENV